MLIFYLSYLYIIKYTSSWPRKRCKNMRANETLKLCANDRHNCAQACADPEIFMRGGPTKMVIFGHRRGGVQPPKHPEITFF